MSTAITTANGSYLNFTIQDDCIDIDIIKSKAKGDGSIMLNELKTLSRQMSLPIELYSCPQDDSISQDDLNRFYEKNGFDLHHDDVDGCYYTWK